MSRCGSGWRFKAAKPGACTDRAALQRLSRVRALAMHPLHFDWRTILRMETDRHRRELIRILQGAYSGELAAGFAYRGHWKSVSNASQRAAIQRIEHEEWIHRQRVGEILTSLGARPRKFREVKMWIIGRIIGFSCHLIGWFLPMYFAGRLESGNVVEYEDAAAHAAAMGLNEYEADLLVMSRVEKEHEIFFLSVIIGHRMLPLVQPIFKWPVSAGNQPTDSLLADGLKEENAGRMPALPGCVRSQAAVSGDDSAT